MTDPWMPGHWANAAADKRRMRRSWAVLGSLLAALLIASLAVDRTDWPAFMGDEATYAMQAESLAFDGDLLYERTDYDRLTAHWEHPPQGLILQSGDAGATITFGKPIFYAAFIAPATRLSPTHGPFVANALWLILAACAAARVLGQRLGPVAPLWVAALVFGSITFAFVFWVHADLFLMGATALALALAYDCDPPPWLSGSRRAVALRWGLVGALLAMVTFSRPLYAPLFLPALLALIPDRLSNVRPQGARTGPTQPIEGRSQDGTSPEDGARLSERGGREGERVSSVRPQGARTGPLIGLVALTVSALGLIAMAASLHHDLTGSWTGYGALRSGFYAHTGFPLVEFSADEWVATIHEGGNAAARSPLQTLQDKPLRPSLLAWNSLYFLVGRYVGLVPYFLPVLLAFAAPPEDRKRWALLLAVAAGIFAFLWTRPYNFYGGGGTLANRYFLPLFPALWFLPGRLPRARWVVATALAAGLFIHPLWLRAGAFPITEEGAYDYVSPAAEWLLPFETSQSHLRLAGREDVYHKGMFLRLVSPELRQRQDGLFRLAGRGGGEMIIASIQPLETLDLVVIRPVASDVEIDEGHVEFLGAVDGTKGLYRLHLPQPDARHPMWWTPERVHIHRVTLRFGGIDDVALFKLRPSP